MYNKICYYISKYCGSRSVADDGLKDDTNTDEIFYDAETGNEILDAVKTIEELYRVEVEKEQTYRELQLRRFEEQFMMKSAQTYEDKQRELYKTVEKLQTTVEDQKLKIENVNNSNEELLQQKVKTLIELYRAEEEEKTSRKLQLHRFEKLFMMKLAQTYEDKQRELYKTVEKLQTTVEDQKLKIENLNNSNEELLQQKVKTLIELHRAEEEEKTSKKLQLHCLLSETVEKLQKMVENQTIIIKDKNNCDDIQQLKLEMITIKNNLNSMNTNFNDLKMKMMFIERTVEIFNNKFGKLKNRIGILEKEMTKNTTHIIEMNYAYQRLSSTIMNFGTGGIVSSPLNTSISSSASTNLPPPPLPTQPPPPSPTLSPRPTPPPPSTSSTPPPPPPPPTSSIPPPPPPPTSSITPPPPPPLMINTSIPTSKREDQDTSKATVKTVEKRYFRIPITEEVLRSVVLKPPGQRTAGKQFSTK